MAVAIAEPRPQASNLIASVTSRPHVSASTRQQDVNEAGHSTRKRWPRVRVAPCPLPVTIPPPAPGLCLCARADNAPALGVVLAASSSTRRRGRTPAAPAHPTTASR